MPQFTQAQLDAFWARYVVMKVRDVIALTNPSSAAYEPEFAGMRDYVYTNRLYGFADYNKPSAGSNMFPGEGVRWNGPTQG